MMGLDEKGGCEGTRTLIRELKSNRGWIGK